MEKTTVYLSAGQKHALARAARAEGRSEADLIREGIESVTARHRVSEPTLPLFASGSPDLAERADEYLEGFDESCRRPGSRGQEPRLGRDGRTAPRLGGGRWND